MASIARRQAAPAAPFAPSAQAPIGSVRSCSLYRGELARHRVITADGHDYVVTTTREDESGSTFLTGAYPVSRGYLVMLRQGLYEIRSAAAETALEQHEQLVRVLAEAGVGVVRARRVLTARRRSERAEALRGNARPHAARDIADFVADSADGAQDALELSGTLAGLEAARASGGSIALN